MSETLKQKAVKGMGWSFLENTANLGVTFIVGLILARLLSPAEFGIIGIITIFISISNTIVDSGFSNALIRRNDANEVDYSTVFYFNIGLSILLYFLLFFLAPAISVFFNQPSLTKLIRVMGLVLIVNAFSIIQNTILIKKVDFKKLTKISLLSSFCGGALGLTMAFSGFGVWSLVGQQLSRQLINTILLWIYNQWLPIFQFSYIRFKSLFSYGSKLLIASLIDSIYNQLYSIIIGKFYKASDLGQYTRAQQFCNIFSNNLSSIVQRVSYPVLSSIQQEETRLKNGFKKTIKSTMLVSFLVMFGLAAIAKPLIVILIGEKWLPSVYYLQILCFSGMFYPFHAINLNILQVKGRSDLILKLEIIKKIIAVVPIVLGVFYGIVTMLWSGFFVNIIAVYMNTYYSKKLINYSLQEQLRDILPFFMISSMMGILVWSLSLLDLSVWIILPLQLFSGFVIYVGLNELYRSEDYVEIRNIVVRNIKRILHVNRGDIK
ncbi:MAG: lipopolysaccharide biosynthesis protein [Bacteroidales bacterium]